MSEIEAIVNEEARAHQMDMRLCRIAAVAAAIIQDRHRSMFRKLAWAEMEAFA